MRDMLHKQACLVGLRALMLLAAVSVASLQGCRDAEAREKPRLTLFGVEGTQAIQFFQLHASMGSGYAPNDSVWLSASKDTVLRVYAGNPSPYPILLSGTFTGSVSWTRYSSSSLSVVGEGQLEPLNGPIPVLPLEMIQRGNIDHTLNFRLAAPQCLGLVAFHIQVFNPTNLDSTAETVYYRYFEEIPSIPIHAVLVGNDQYPSPSLFEAWDALYAHANRIYPMPHFYLTDYELFDSGIKPDQLIWTLLLGDMHARRQNDPFRSLWVAFLPGEAGSGGSAFQGSNGVAVVHLGHSTSPNALALVLGTAMGLKLAWCAEHEDYDDKKQEAIRKLLDPDYPRYGFYPEGSIGEFGLNTASLEVYDPASSAKGHDFMGDPCGTWISPYHWEKLRQRAKTWWSDIPRELTVSATSVDVLSLSCRLHSDGRVELRPSFHDRRPVHAASLPLHHGLVPRNKFVIRLLDQAGQILVSKPCRSITRTWDAAQYIDLYEEVPWNAKAHTISFYLNDDLVGSLQVEEQVPTVELTRFEQQNRRVILEWKVSDGLTRQPQFMVRYSNDDGETWRLRAVGVTNTSWKGSTDLLPGGLKCRFQVIAMSGVRSGSSETEPFSLPQRGREARILAPSSPTSTSADETVVFRAAAFSPDFGFADRGQLEWSSDIDGDLGRGRELVRSLSVGDHTIVLNAPDGMGGTCTTQVRVTVGPGLAGDRRR